MEGVKESSTRSTESIHIAHLLSDVEEAKKRYAPTASWSPEGVGYFIQSVLQGSFIFAKAQQSPAVVRQNLDHLKRYLRALFNQPPSAAWEQT